MLNYTQLTPNGLRNLTGYHVTLDNTCTVQEFIDAVLKERPHEWGCIEVQTAEKRDKKLLYLYNRGKLETEIEDQSIMTKQIGCATANSGQSRMDYAVITTD